MTTLDHPPRIARAARRARAPLWLLLLGALAACSPTLNWREVRPEGSDALLLMPCKPASQARRVELAGAQVEWTLFACQAMGMTWGFGFTELDDPSRVAAVLRELQRSALAHIGAGDGEALPLRVEGAAPEPAGVRLAASGRVPGGRPVQQQIAFFARGARVYQASIVGPVVLAEEAQTFFDGLSLR